MTFRMTSRRLNDKGFTIIELMVATVVFSMVLLLCTYGIIHVGNDYYKGITEARTQENARSLVDRISQDIQFSGGSVFTGLSLSGSPVKGFCIGSHLYSFITDGQLVTNGTPNASQNQVYHAMVVEDVPACSATTTPSNINASASLATGQEELISANVRIQPYDSIPSHQNIVWSDASQPGLYNVGMKLIYGDNDALDATRTKCLGGAEIQFCAVSSLLSSVQPRFFSSH